MSDGTQFRFVFDPERHTYALDGRPLPHVTGVLSALGLISYEGIAPDVLDRKRRIGQAVHAATHYYDEGTLDEASLSPIVRPYIAAWQRFRLESGFKPIELERAVYSAQYRYAGTFDRIGWLNGLVVLLDIKVVRQLQPAVSLQTAAYAQAAHETFGARIAARYAVKLYDDEQYRLSDPFMDPQDLHLFLAALALATWKGNQK